MALIRTMLLGCVLSICGAGAEAEELVRLEDGAGFAVEGRVVSFDGEFYRLEVETGRLTLAARGLTCIGAACPDAPSAAYTLSAADPALRRLAIVLLRDFARTETYPMGEVFGPNGIEAITLEDLEMGGEVRFNFTASGGDFQVLRSPGRNSRDIALAFDALIPAVSVENSVTGLTMVALRAALAGEFPDWSGLGGHTDPVTVYWPRGFESPIADRFGLRPNVNLIERPDFARAAQALTQDAGGLALLPSSEIGQTVPLVVTGACGRGTLGVGDAVRTGDYPLAEVISLKRPSGRPVPMVRQFLAWLQSERATQAVRRAGFVDLGVAPVRFAFDGRQEADPVTLSLGPDPSSQPDLPSLEGARRLNVAMRFQDGSSQPDRVARIQIARLTHAVRTGRFEGQSLIFMGFSDADGAATTNLRLSERRAETIRNELVGALNGTGGIRAFEAIGMGEAMPVACNGVDWGERLNRRVEVWVSD